ncbi:IspD/TarI family cytidylyltransferase [Amycolatopsis taiwanensis]|uniref:IspD/TarI family cytidylyltransferase n=1 Tax=Amycolatopsis taiwanensis TaxID=342230 RepID=UPI002554EE3B|nr:2-C-methyl-D-erythritol 4-phosphate cytidylyltransferase [Amycolatopsis taiwanensis]
MTTERAMSTRVRPEPPISMQVVALLVADIDAIRVAVRGEPLLAHAIRGLAESGCVDHVVVAAPTGAESIVRAVPGARCRVLPAAATRADSIRCAFEAAGSCDVVLLHDAVRAFVPAATIRSVVEAVRRGAEAVAPVVPVTDTVKLVGADGVITATEDRTRLRTLQTPLGYARNALRDACARGIDPMSFPPGTVQTVAGHPNALRLATPFDVAVAEALLAQQA